jgi:hypothetical protein
VAGDRAAAVAALERIVELLRSRHRSRAFARRTLNLVWAIPGPLPSALDEIGWLCPPANVRLVVCEPDAVDCSP